MTSVIDQYAADQWLHVILDVTNPNMLSVVEYGRYHAGNYRDLYDKTIPADGHFGQAGAA